VPTGRTAGDDDDGDGDGDGAAGEAGDDGARANVLGASPPSAAATSAPSPSRCRQRRSRARGESAQQRVDLLGLGVVAHARDAGLQRSRRLRSAQQQLREHGELGRADVQHLVELVAELRHAAAAVDPRDDALLLQRHQRTRDLERHQLGDRVAVVLLVAAVDQRVLAERVGVGHGRLLLDQRADDALLGAVEADHPLTPSCRRHQGGSRRAA
jgi:hypothetical protein